MANVTEDVARIRAAIYGEEVRESIAHAIEDMNEESSGAYSAAISAQDSASASASSALSSKEAAAAAAEVSQQIKIDVESLKASTLVFRNEAVASAESAGRDKTSVDESLSQVTLMEANVSSMKDDVTSMKASTLVLRNETEQYTTDASIMRASTLIFRNEAKEYKDDAEAAYNATAHLHETAKSWAVGPSGAGDEGTDTNNAAYWADYAKDVSDSILGKLSIMGTITFAELPLNPQAGWMYNISDAFVTDSRFKGGAGRSVPAGSNVYYTADGYWDIDASAGSVNGVKGEAESTYRQGNVSLSPADLGIASIADSYIDSIFD